MSEAVKAATTIVRHFRDGSFTDDALANALGYGAVQGGAFRQRVADLRKYGLITGRGSQLGAGPIAQAIFADHPGDREKALHDMMSNISLFKALYDHFGDKFPDDNNLMTVLLNITGAARPDIEGSLVMLRDAYKDACSTLPTMSGGTKPMAAGPSFGRGPGDVRAQPTGGDRFASSTTDYEFSVADDTDAIDSLIDQLQSRKKALERKQKSAPKVHGPDGAVVAGRNVTALAGGTPPAEK